MTVTVDIVGVPVARGDRVKGSWREIAAWVSRELDRAFGDSVRVQYHDLFEARCPNLPADAKLPIVLIDGEPITVSEHVVGAIRPSRAGRNPDPSARSNGDTRHRTIEIQFSPAALGIAERHLFGGG